MFAVITPPAIHASSAPCIPAPKTGINAGASEVRFSPDCRWVLVFQSDVGPPPAFKLARPLKPETAAVIEAKSGKVVATFAMQRDAYPHWLKDGRYLVVNYLAGSDSTRPLVIRLAPPHNLYDLSSIVLPDVLKRIRHRKSQVYHYYVNYLGEEDGRITISAQPDYVARGDSGRGDGRCLIYSIDTATLHHYRLTRMFRDDDTHPCPQNPDERRE